MQMVTGPLLTIVVGGLTAVLVLAGGVIFFAFGKSRGMLAGIGFVVLAFGVVAGTVLAVLIPLISARTGASPAATVATNSVIQILTDLAGWGLVITAMLRLRSERAADGPATPPYAPPGAPPSAPPYTGPDGGPGWGHPASGTEGPPPPPGV